jgi:hypothetical protein
LRSLRSSAQGQNPISLTGFDVKQTLRIATVDAAGGESCRMKFARRGSGVCETQAPDSRPVI